MNISTVGKAVTFDHRYLHVELADGRIISTPLSWYPELLNAPVKTLGEYRLICQGTGIEWEGLDYHLSIESMLYGHHHQAAA
ncbi:MAG: DUF2442 domain-containing protein [Methylococcaceae bacterium]|nr:DUF2442 domain-containing protein [Methylococcaceae bacterium]